MSNNTANIYNDNVKYAFNVSKLIVNC